MKVNFIKFVFILFLIFILFMPTFSYGKSYLIDTNYYYLYTYKFDTNSANKMSYEINNAKSDDRVVSGEYYYFVYWNNASYNNDIGKGIYYVKKSDLPFVYFDFFSWADELQGFTFYNGSTNNSMFISYGSLNSDDRLFNILLATNYDGDIYINRNGNDTVYLQHSSPYIADDDDTISKLNGSYFLIYPNNSNNTNLHFSVCQTETVSDGDLIYDRETVLADFSLDSSSPYYNCPLGDEVWYEVPYSVFPKNLSIKKGEEYNWRLQYDFNGVTNYVDRKIVSQVNYSFTGSSRCR